MWYSRHVSSLPHSGRSFTAHTGELSPRMSFSLADILVLAGGVILPVPAVPARSRISAKLTRVQEYTSAVNVAPLPTPISAPRHKMTPF